jgi:hypothetical protein
MPPSTELSLAPAAGTGIGRLVAEALLADPEFIPALKGALMGGLRATQLVRMKGVSDFAREPDFKTRVQAAVATLAHMEGDPIKRVIHQHLGVEGKTDLIAALQESPALLEATKRVIANAEAGQRHGKGASRAQRAAQVVDAESSELPE